MDIQKSIDRLDVEIEELKTKIDEEHMLCQDITDLEELIDKAIMFGDLCAKRDAKAQAVPEGFVLIKASDRDQEMLELIDQRDHMESQAEELKDKLQALYGVDFGEHSSCNFPFQNAIDYDDSDLVLVPKEPTYEMLEAGSEARSRTEGHIASIWEVMIEAQEPAND